MGSADRPAPRGEQRFVDLLAKTEFFAETPHETLQTILAEARERALVRGDVLFREGDQATRMYLVLDGRLAMVIVNAFDQRETVVALMEAGDLFGEMSLLDDSVRSATARTLEPSRVLEIPFLPVAEAFDADPKMLRGVSRLLARRLRVMDEALADSVFLDVTGRTAKRLLEMSSGKDSFSLPVTQEELAGMVGASRERVNKAIASFIRLGWLEQHDRQYRILQRPSLELRSR